MAIKLENLVRSGIQKKPPRTVFYSTPGFGKTFFAGTLPKCVLLPTEDGSSEIDIDRLTLDGHDKIETWDEFIQIMNLLISDPHDWRSLCLDTASALETIIHREVCKDENYGVIDEIPYGGGYKIAAQKYWQVVLDLLDELRNERNMMILVNAHESITMFKNPAGDDYNRYDLQLRKEVVPMLVKWADNVFFGNYSVNIQDKGDTFGKTVFKADGVGERIIYTSERPSHKAKNRYCLPSEIEFPSDLDWKVVAEHIKKHFNGAKEKSNG